MKNQSVRSLSLACGAWIALAVCCYAGDPLVDALRMGYGNMAETKQKAEGGDVGAQLALGSVLARRARTAEALSWYQKAAEQKNVEGEFEVGRLLLFGAAWLPDDQRIQAKPAEGIRWTFAAATNLHAGACWNMYRAYHEGIGVRTNLVQAIAWLNLNIDSQASKIVGRVELNQLALKLDTDTMAKGKQLAMELKAGKWQAPVARQFSESDSRLKLNGISSGPAGPLAIINGKTLARGETAMVSTKPPGSLKVTLLELSKDAVLVQIEGETEPRVLRVR